MSVLDKVKNIIALQLSLDMDELSEKTDIAEDLGADSLDVVELVMTLEDEFGLMIEDEEVMELKTIGDVVNYIETHVN